MNELQIRNHWYQKTINIGNINISTLKEHLQCVVNAFYAEIYQDLSSAVNNFDQSELFNIPHNELLRHTNPVVALEDICHACLLIGDQPTLKFGMRVVYLLYDVQREIQCNKKAVDLYKGCMQIGLGMIDLGIKNVMRGLNFINRAQSTALEMLLGYWALTSAAIQYHDLNLAVTFAKKWHQAANDQSLPEEQFRARIALLLLHYVLGKRVTSEQSKFLLNNWTGQNWGVLESFLHKLLVDDQTIKMENVVEPYPLFLGVSWLKTKDRNNKTKDFTSLFQTRYAYKALSSSIQALNVDEIESLLDLYAHWELANPFAELELMLKEREPTRYFYRLSKRLLGKEVAHAVLNQTSIDTSVNTVNNAIILVMDIRQFSNLCEQQSPAKSFALLNPVFKILQEILEPIGGVLIEFIGDSIIFAFNTFTGLKKPIDIHTLLLHTTHILKRLRSLNIFFIQNNRTPISIGIGISKGIVGLGYLGGLDRCHLTLLGNAINLAARLESATKSLPGEIIVSASCFDTPTPDIWCDSLQANYSLRDLGNHTMRNINTPVHLYGIKPLINSWVDFVPMGFVATPESGVVYLDTGNSNEAGIIDHHFSGGAKSACELLVNNPNRLLDHLKGVTQYEFRVHMIPDLDCAATLYTAYELLQGNPRLQLLQHLASYVSQIDQGVIPHPENLHNSLYGVLLAHLAILEKQSGHLSDMQRLESQLRIIDAALYILDEQKTYGLDNIFDIKPTWFVEERRLIKTDWERYEDDRKNRGHLYEASINIDKHKTRVVGLWLDHPQSIVFKFWVRNDPHAPTGHGYPFLTVNWSEPDKSRFVISVDPESSSDLRGLGEQLELAETEKRKRERKERPIHPVRYLADNSDPWYFGQGHAFTIIDSPRCGTLLTAEEVERIHANWKDEKDR